MKEYFGLDDKVLFKNKRNDVLAIGEILIDMIATKYEGSHTYQQFFGGAPANIAMNVKRLGIHSLVASAVGEDKLGDFLIQHLRNNDIDPHLIQQVENSTSMVVLDKSTGSPIPIFYRDADYRLLYTKDLEQALEESKIMHFSSWPISKMPARSTMERMLDVARASQVMIGFDPNYHKMVWQKGEDGVAYIKSVMRRVDVVKPSEDDAERLFGPDTPRNQIEKFLDLGVRLVIMTLGKDGVIVSNGTETLEQVTLATEVADVTGAGDAFWSGFYTAIVKGYTIKEAIVFGNAISAYKLKYVGAVVELPKLEKIKSIYQL